MMNFKKTLKEFANIILMIAIFTLSSINNLLAVADHALKTNYTVTQSSSGDMIFDSSLGNLSLMIYTKGTILELNRCKEDPDGFACDWGGDLSIELGNPLCITYAALYAMAMYAGNAIVKGTATIILLAAVSIIFGIASFKYRDFEICGVDWLVWGYDAKLARGGDLTAAALSDYREYYPKKGAFGGSKKYNAIQCTKNFNECVEVCNAQNVCASQFQKAIENKDKEAYAKLEKCANELKFPCMLNLEFMEKDGERTYLNSHDKVFRERFYDGEEIQNSNCLDPRADAKKYDVNVGKSANEIYQLYYMRGYDPGNYACDRFLLEKEQDGDKFDEAYQCCVKASNSICIKDKMGASIETREQRIRFCDVSNKYCDMKAFRFEIFSSKEGETGKYCAKTWSLCPYNFNIQKGTEDKLSFQKKVTTETVSQKVNPSCKSGCEMKEVETIKVVDECYDSATDTTKDCQGKIKNFYQYNRHCTIVSIWPVMPKDNDTYPPFIDKACINFVGSSHNTTGYTVYHGYDKMFKTYRSFTAPMAECITETLKNFLFNRAGHTQCSGSTERPNDRPDMYGNCKTGYDYTEGDNLLEAKGILPPAVKLLSYIHTLIMLAVTLMITLYGYNILINSGKLERHDLVMNMLKVVIVISFSASSWWYDQLFRFTYSFSNTFSTITSKIGFDDTRDALGNYVKSDGCFFGNINTLLDLDKEPGYAKPNIEENNFYLYPYDRRYISFFDAIDCKVSKYLGYGVSLDAPNLILLLAMTFIWPFNIGIFLAVGTLLLALFAINFAIKAVYIFIASSIAMSIMLYMAPLIIPCILFKKTKGIFDKWLKNLISFALQPMVMFAFVSMALTIMDKYTLGDGIYAGVGINKELICGYACIDNESGVVTESTSAVNATAFNKITQSCTDTGTVVNMKRNSILCFLDNMTSGPASTLQSLGLFIPVLTDFITSDVIMFLRVGFLFFILTKVLETVPGIASNLTGGKTLPGTDKGNPFSTAKKLFNFVENAKRAVKGIGQKIGNSMKKKDKSKGKGKDGDKKEGEDEKNTGEKRDTLKDVSVKKRSAKGGAGEK